MEATFFYLLPLFWGIGTIVLLAFIVWLSARLARLEAKANEEGKKTLHDMIYHIDPVDSPLMELARRKQHDMVMEEYRRKTGMTDAMRENFDEN